MPAPSRGQRNSLVELLAKQAGVVVVNNVLGIRRYFMSAELLLSQVGRELAGCLRPPAWELAPGRTPIARPPLARRPRCTARPATRSSCMSCSCGWPGGVAEQAAPRSPAARRLAAPEPVPPPRPAPPRSLIIETIPKHREFSSSDANYAKLKQVGGAPRLRAGCASPGRAGPAGLTTPCRAAAAAAPAAAPRPIPDAAACPSPPPTPHPCSCW
jgi:hypothetical protein